MCTDSITRVLESTHCFAGAGQTIPVNNVLNILSRKNQLPKGAQAALNKVAIAKFKKIVEAPKQEKKYKDIAKTMKNKDKKKKKDPLDADKTFLLGLVKEFEEKEIFLPEEEKYIQGIDTSGHAKQILGFLHSREEFWEQI